MSEKELVAELELAACCGIPPYTPDTLMEIEVSEHSVRAFLPAEYARPRRLTPAEGFAVAASARLLLTVPGSEDDALRRALAKLDAALGSREAVGARRRRAGRIWRRCGRRPTPARPSRSTTSPVPVTSSRRGTVEPVQVATIDGHWYLDAYCHRAGDMRRFRVDRIDAVRPAAESPGPAVTQSRPLEEMFVPGPGAVEVHLQLGRGRTMGTRVRARTRRAPRRRRHGDRRAARRLRHGLVRTASGATRPRRPGGEPARADRPGR